VMTLSRYHVSLTRKQNSLTRKVQDTPANEHVSERTSPPRAIQAGLDSSDFREIGLLAVVLSENTLQISFY